MAKSDDGKRSRSLMGRILKRNQPPAGPAAKPLKPPPPPDPELENAPRGKFLFARKKVAKPKPVPRPIKPQPAPPPQPEVKPLTRSQRWRQRAQRLRAPLKSLSLVGTGVAIALIALFIFSALNPAIRPLSKGDVQSLVANAMASATPQPPWAAIAYQQIEPSLVRINIRQLGSKGEMESGHGTGIVLDERGTILTSLHVVKSALEIKVIFYEGTESQGILAASQPEKDIAVVRTFQPPALLLPATLGNPRFLRPGDDAIVVGNPFGLTNSLSAGSISGLGRTFIPPNGGQQISGLIQFDAAVNPGNSGGPLLNRYGEVMGIVTGLVNPTGQDVFIGIGFAVPIDVAAAAAGTPPY